MKLFIWYGDGVLQDYSSGMICALGHDLQEALEVIRKECDYCMGSFPNDMPTETIEFGRTRRPPRAWICWGGG